MAEPRIAYAGNRQISVWVLRFIIQQGVKPLALLIPDEARATGADELIGLCAHLGTSQVLRAAEFRSDHGIELLRNLELDYIICVHFPYVVPKEVLELPAQGVMNLHPAYLPYNRGWHTPTWAILDGTPYGATLHFMDDGIDTGDIIHQKEIEVLPRDTADTLYKRVMKLELEVFKEAWPYILSGKYPRKPQPLGEGSVHSKADITSIQFVDLHHQAKAGDLIRRLRALTTNDITEAAFFETEGKRHRMQLRVFDVEDN